MKRIILITLSAISLWACDKQHKKTDAEEMHLKGKVKSVKQTTYKAVEKFGQVERGSESGFNNDNFYVVFNEKGNCIEEVRYNSEGNIDRKSTLAYDEKENCIERVRYNAEGSIDEKMTLAYDDKGNKIECVFYNSDDSIYSKSTYAYDEKGNCIEEVWYNSEDSIDVKSTYFYDEKGNVRTVVWYDSEGSMTRKNIYDYEGNQIQVDYYNSEGKFYRETYTYEYDTHDNWIKKITYKNDKAESIAEREITYYE
ncbi:hypothetical protein ACQ1Q1_08150 [Ornithobacterium rhinotracheale]|uniref:RHS repeat protein n=1 Tax=Ornithobacterium rhinotracheale (strain ATCC 51463 / DSM 15997 / CCUG 23171 / CIP 104009 / LMG 9086) TaxID=867902 RepID=I3ZYA5_ORNRL|nr:hypothetical protein [Ornithobacterium rhinotracheale]AFL96689.1 hypothetical protein Ornrh_0482 [Ornithobacterium rhinotracheale DSM 15997]AIQ00581.1 hypothetical protein Q785_07320 [Ornithobacterium rhinotracheale ORT-UMN 88]KGB66748.1 hypothetical protein Q787_07220 [Ornithobacterium rhinotracheale H06-030791]MCK0194038.1 hypothetical protein [Ornithobacterium rhinotracheale]MCK0201755.1 hypothetical protein [Ornithobacterium rhinotracheale]